jgi:hypothetical protein
MSIVGKFFCFCGEEYLHTGEIVEQLDAATVLVRFTSASTFRSPARSRWRRLR